MGGRGPALSRLRRGAAVAAVAAGAWAALSAASVARADPTQSEILAARNLFASAEKDEDAGHWQTALDKLRRASSVKMTAGIRFHIALCEEKLGRLVDALADYSAAQTQAFVEKNKDVLDALGEPLTALRARVPTITVKVPADVPDAKVTLDGAPLPAGLWGTAITVDAGPHYIEARAAARTPFTMTIMTELREAEVVDVKLPAEVVAEPVAPAAARPAPEPAPPPSTEQAKTDSVHRSQAGALVAGAAAIVLAGAGVGAFVVAASKQSDGQAACAARATSCDDLRGPVRTFDWLALGAWVGAAGAAGLAVVLWTRPASSPDREARLVVGPGSVGVAGRF